MIRDAILQSEMLYDNQMRCYDHKWDVIIKCNVMVRDVMLWFYSVIIFCTNRLGKILCDKIRWHIIDEEWDVIIRWNVMR